MLCYNIFKGRGAALEKANPMKQTPIHGCSCGHEHAHTHSPLSPHPPQPAPWSILRMTLAGRLIGAVAVTAGLWAIVLLAMRAA
jgi:hypothetical protein